MIAVNVAWEAFQPPLMAVTVDIVVLTIRHSQLQVLVIRRGIPPFEGSLALPGGFVGVAEDLEETVARELAEETSLDAAQLHLEQLRTYGAPARDPRGRVITVAYLAIGPNLPTPAGGSDAADAGWMPVSEMLLDGVLAFDHRAILSDGVERARAKLEYTTLAAAFCDSGFTMTDLRRVYEIVWDIKLDPRNFHRKVIHTKGFVEPLGEKRALDAGRPAALYERGVAIHMMPPMLRGAAETRA